MHLWIQSAGGQAMTRDDIIKMAKEAGLPTAWISESELTLFAALVAAAEREECAEAIRARGET